MVEFRANTSFRVVPEAWDKIEDNAIVRMFDAFANWVILNEEDMYCDVADEAWEMMERWKAYLIKRNLAPRSHNQWFFKAE